jgi:flagellar motor switch protein FliG
MLAWRYADGSGESRCLAGELVALLRQNELLPLRGVGKIGVITHDEIGEVFDDLTEKAQTAGLQLDGSGDYLQTVLTKAFGQDKAQELCQRILKDVPDAEGVETLKEMDASVLAPFLAEEHPQTVAFLLAHLYPGHAANVLTLLEESKQAEIAYRLSQLARTDATIIDQLSQTLSQQVPNFSHSRIWTRSVPCGSAQWRLPRRPFWIRPKNWRKPRPFSAAAAPMRAISKRARRKVIEVVIAPAV